jgi:hypothetical protein
MIPFDHLHHFKEMLCITKLLPKGDIPTPNAALQVQWFYMSFRCSDRGSGHKLSNETLQTLAKYFESICLARISDGSIQRKYDEQLCSAAKRKLHHELEECYREKLKRFSESREGHSSRIARPPSRMVSLTGRAICMAPTASIPTMSAART